MTASDATRILLTGATGYVGGRLLPLLEARSFTVRCLARNPAKHQRQESNTEWVAGDVLQPETLQAAMQGIDTAIYLVHLMSDAGNFEDLDRQAAENFATAARMAGVRKLIYLGGLGDDTDPNLSPHLRSRHEVGEILRNSGITTIEFRAGMVIGQGSLSYQLMQSLTDRLPVMLCPRWLATPTQPIAIDDVLQYLLAAIERPFENHECYEIGCPEVATYGDLIRKYARLRGLRRWLINVPFLTPYLSGLWLALVTPATYKVGRHLIEGLRNPTIVQNTKAMTDFPIRPLGIQQALEAAAREHRA